MYLCRIYYEYFLNKNTLRLVPDQHVHFFYAHSCFRSPRDEKINSDIYRKIQNYFLNLTISKHFNKISQFQCLQQYTITHQPWPTELAKLTNSVENRKWLDNTTNNSSAPSTPSYSYGWLNENTYITSKKSLTVEARSITTFDLYNKPAGIIQNKNISKPYTKDMLISNICVYEDAQSLATPRKKCIVSLHQGPIFFWVMTMISHLKLP